MAPKKRKASKALSPRKGSALRRKSTIAPTNINNDLVNKSYQEQFEISLEKLEQLREERRAKLRPSELAAILPEY